MSNRLTMRRGGSRRWENWGARAVDKRMRFVAAVEAGGRDGDGAVLALWVLAQDRLQMAEALSVGRDRGAERAVAGAVRASPGGGCGDRRALPGGAPGASDLGTGQSAVLARAQRSRGGAAGAHCPRPAAAEWSARTAASDIAARYCQPAGAQLARATRPVPRLSARLQ